MSDPKPATAKQFDPLVPVRTAEGVMATVPASQLQQELDAGSSVASSEELQRAEMEAQYGGVADVVGAAGMGVLRGATLGLSDAAAVGLAGESGRETLNAWKELHPGASVGGELAGALAPLALSGGGAAPESGLSVGRTIRGLGALPRAVGALGEAGASATRFALGEGIAGRLGSAVVRGGLEGAAYGTGSAISEAYLGDHDITAEYLLGGARDGLLFGALAGGATAGLGEFVTAGRSRLTRAASEADIEALAERKFGEAAPGLGKSVYRTAEKPIATTVEQAAEAPEALGDIWRRRAELLNNHEQTLEKATRDVTEKLNVAIKAERAVDMAAFGEAKATQMARLVPEANWRQARDTALSVWDDAGKVIAELQADPTRGGAGVAVNRAAKWLEKFGNELGDIATRKDKSAVASELFAKLDDFKRAMGDGAKFGQGPFGLPEAAKEFDALYHRTRSALENEGVWGKAAAAQREINEATAARLGTRRQFGATFTSQYGSTAGRPDFVANPDGVQGYVRNLTSAKNDLKHQAIQEYITNEERFLGAVEKHYQLGPAEKSQIAEARRAFGAMRETIDATSKDVMRTNQLKQLMAEEKASGIGGLSGFILDSAMMPLTRAQRVAQVEAAARKMRERIEGSVKSFFGGGAPGKVTLPASETSQKRFDEAVKQVQRLSSEPEALSQRLGAASQEVVDVAPRVSARLGMVGGAAVAFLASKIPGRTVDPNSLTPHLEQVKVSDADRAKYLRYVRAVNDPATVAEDLAKGRINREGVEALKVVYPETYKALQMEVMKQLTELKKPMPYQKKVQLGILLDIPTDVTLSTPFLRSMQDLYKQESQQPEMPQGSSFNLSIDSRTATERVAGR